MRHYLPLGTDSRLHARFKGRTDWRAVDYAEAMKLELDVMEVDAAATYEDLYAAAFLQQPTHMLCRTNAEPGDAFGKWCAELSACGYEFRGRSNDRMQFSKPSVLFIADVNWSTGSIVKDLQRISTVYDVGLAHWAKRIDALPLSEYDGAVGLTLGVAYGWPGAVDASVCCSEYDQEWSIKAYKTQVELSVVGGVSAGICRKVAQDNPRTKVVYTPATARMSRFRRGRVRPALKTLGWCGDPNRHPLNLKRYVLFEEICKRTGLLPMVSGTGFKYEEMQDFYDRVDLLLCTSVSEGGPLPVFEAVACGVPVLSTPVGLAGESGIFRQYADADSACKLIESLKTQSARAECAEQQHYCLDNAWSMERLFPWWERFMGLARKRSVSFL
jgi:hypothetical protein